MLHLRDSFHGLDGGGVGVGEARGEDEWLRAYGRLAAMVPPVEALAAGRERLEAVNAIQHEFWEARDVLLQCRLLQVDESRRTWEAKCVALRCYGDDGMFARKRSISSAATLTATSSACVITVAGGRGICLRLNLDDIPEKSCIVSKAAKYMPSASAHPVPKSSMLTTAFMLQLPQ